MRPNNFNDLLEMQKQLDDAVSEKRDNGFIPRERTEFDIRMALDDEFNEFMKELPQELNFKTWKEIKHDPEKQLEEFVDCWFFIAQAINNTNKISLDDILTFIDIFEESDSILKRKDIIILLSEFKENLNCGSVEYTKDIQNIMIILLNIGSYFGYGKNKILETYYKKWQKNIKRIKGDWSL